MDPRTRPRGRTALPHLAPRCIDWVRRRINPQRVRASNPIRDPSRTVIPQAGHPGFYRWHHPPRPSSSRLLSDMPLVRQPAGQSAASSSPLKGEAQRCPPAIRSVARTPASWVPSDAASSNDIRGSPTGGVCVIGTWRSSVRLPWYERLIA